MIALSDLIRELADAAKGSPDLDAKIAAALGYNVEWDDGEPYYGPHNKMPIPVPCFTKWLDAAVTLVPEGWHVSHAWWDEQRAGFNITLKVGVYAEGRSATPALALCIAALKAREA